MKNKAYARPDTGDGKCLVSTNILPFLTFGINCRIFSIFVSTAVIVACTSENLPQFTPDQSNLS